MFADNELVNPNKEKCPGELVERPQVPQPMEKPGLLTEGN